MIRLGNQGNKISGFMILTTHNHMKSELSKLQPSRLWEIFEEICMIPRASGKEEKILKYLKDFSAANNLEFNQDRTGNLVIRKQATRGFEHFPSVALQSHVDMVCEKNSGTKHNFDNDPIIPYIEDGWVKAKGTTLGADDGIGMAAQLALLESDSIEHGPLECLFTVEEETGLAGAFGLEENFLKSRILLNLDSEDDGELFIGCAGGLDTTIHFPMKKVNTEPDHQAYRINISGLKGGHSGDDINRHRGNAIKILNRLLWNLERNNEMRLADIEGGNLRNAIPREANATVTVPSRQLEGFLNSFGNLVKEIHEELKSTEPGLNIEIRQAIMPDCLIEHPLQLKLLNALYACPHGVIAMSYDIPGLVETSTNLASVTMMPHGIIIATSQRSAVVTAMRDVSDMVCSVFQLAGAIVKQGEGYPGWKPDMDSKILDVMQSSYRKLFGVAPKVLAIHAGLECGLIGEKFPGMDMISYGPTIKGAHSPDERIEISTVHKFWDLTLDVLKKVGDVA